MPGDVKPVADEREGLLEYLAQQRYTLRLTSYGLSDEQATASPSASALSVAGIIKHVALTERSWMDVVTQRPSRMAPDVYVSSFHLTDGETLQSVLDLYDEVAAETAQIMAGIADLGQPVPVPPNPWNPPDVQFWSVRWVLLHLIEETARHGGHADIVRETVDGATFHPLMAAAEGWPESDWITPWKPAASAT